jgi:hypothetical protein
MTRNQQADLKLLDLIGTFLYGDRWQAALADALNLNPRTVRGWVQGRSHIQPESWHAINALLAKKVDHGPEVKQAMKAKMRQIKEFEALQQVAA